MPKITIDNREIEFTQGMSVMQACELAGVEIPRFCYHDRLKIAGNCRMCLVEIKGGPPKPTASCAFPAGDGMIVCTDTPMVKKAREGVLEFQLINHPLDCPVCDQGGECDLQDLAIAYGISESRYKEPKHTVPPKNYGPLIKTNMTRCIHCTRCIRFMEDIAGVPEIGGIGRGEEMEIGTFIEKNINSELSGNIIDVCPVGALNSKPYQFSARGWELKHTESVDVHDAVGSNIRIDTRNGEVMRILPLLNEDVNEVWLSDKSRFAYDGLRNQRLDRPMVRKNGKLEATTWNEAFRVISEKVRGIDGNKIAAIAGDLVDAESMLVMKKLMEKIGSPNMDCRQDGVRLGDKNRASYLFNTTIAGIEEADACLVIGANPRIEAPIVNARIRKRWLKGDFPIATIGAECDLGYPAENLGGGARVIEEILSGKNQFGKILRQAKKPMVIVGTAVLNRNDSLAILKLISDLCDKLGVFHDGWNGFNILHTAASRVAGLELGFLPKDGGKDVPAILKAAKSKEVEVVYLLGADEVDMSALLNAFIIYQGHHGDKGAHAADVILPGAAYTEKNATYLNMEGRVQHTRLASFPPGDAKEDWKIISELAAYLGFGELCDGITQVRDLMVQEAESFANVGGITKADWVTFGQKGDINDSSFEKKIDNFYMTDVISRASKTMAECSIAFTDEASSENGKKVA